jgi:hypothetical protein
MPVRSVLTQNPDQKELDVQLFVKRPKARLCRMSRGDQKNGAGSSNKEPNFIYRKEV